MCKRCHGTGRTVERVDMDPYGAIPRTITSHGFCDCDAGWNLKARQIEAAEAAFEAHCAAMAYADAHVSPPPHGDH